MQNSGELTLTDHVGEMLEERATAFDVAKLENTLEELGA
jgi:hypothetical protein